jgi:hypothetical protein
VAYDTDDDTNDVVSVVTDCIFGVLRFLEWQNAVNFEISKGARHVDSEWRRCTHVDASGAMNHQHYRQWGVVYSKAILEDSQ